MAISKNRRDTEQGRFYDIKVGDKWIALPSVSTILEIINRPGLLRWYGKLGLEEAERIRDDTAHIGSKAHALIERICDGGAILQQEWDELDERVRNALRGFVCWRKTTGFVPRHSELTIYSLKHGYAGTLDAMGLINNRATLADWKVTGALWPEVKLQLAAYYMAYLETFPGRKISDIRAVRFDRLTGDYQEECLSIERDIIPAFEVFLAMKQGWDYLRGGLNGTKRTH